MGNAGCAFSAVVVGATGALATGGQAGRGVRVGVGVGVGVAVADDELVGEVLAAADELIVNPRAGIAEIAAHATSQRADRRWRAPWREEEKLTMPGMSAE